MKNMKYLSSIAILALTHGTSTRAGMVTGTFEGVADIEVQQFVHGQQVGPTVTYQGVASTLNFTITTGTAPFSGTFEFSLANSVFSLDTNMLPGLPPFEYLAFGSFVASITDGIPGQSADAALGSVFVFVEHLWSLNAGVRLVDPTGEFIGPNGDGDTSNVQINAEYIYQMFDTQDNGQTITTSFMTVPEPSSIVLTASGSLLVLAVALVRAHRVCQSELAHPTRG
jgi:hypothetical protein